MNSSGVSSDSYLAVKLYQQPLLQSYHRIEDYDVPIFRNHFIDLSSLSWDISYQYIILHIDGLSNVKQITSEVNMDSSAIRRCLSLLLFHQQIILADMFKFSNVYKVNTDQAIVYFNNNCKMDELRRNVALTIDSSHTSNESGNNNSDSDNNKSDINDGRNNNNNTNIDNGDDPLRNGDVDDDGNNNNDEVPTIQQIISFLLKLQQNRTIKQIIIDSLDDVSRSPAELLKIKRSRHNDDDVDDYDSDDIGGGTVGRNNNNASGSSKNIYNKHTNNKSKLDLRNIDLPKLIGYCKHEGR